MREGAVNEKMERRGKNAEVGEGKGDGVGGDPRKEEGIRRPGGRVSRRVEEVGEEEIRSD